VFTRSTSRLGRRDPSNFVLERLFFKLFTVAVTDCSSTLFTSCQLSAQSIVSFSLRSSLHLFFHSFSEWPLVRPLLSNSNRSTSDTADRPWTTLYTSLKLAWACLLLARLLWFFYGKNLFEGWYNSPWHMALNLGNYSFREIAVNFATIQKFWSYVPTDHQKQYPAMYTAGCCFLRSVGAPLRFT